MLAAVQYGGEQRLVRAQFVERPLADVGAEVPDLGIDLLEGQVKGKLPHPLDQGLGSCGERVLLVRP